MSVHKRDRPKPWEVRYRDENGRNRAKSFRTEREAKRFDRDQATRKDTGDFIGPDRENMTVGDFYLKTFLPTRTVSTATRTSYGHRWLPTGRPGRPADPKVWHVGQKWGKVKLVDVNRKEAVLRWHGEMREAGASKATIHRAHDLLVHIINEAVELEYLPRNRILGMRPSYQPKASRKTGPWLPADIEDLREHFLYRSRNLPPTGSRGGGAVHWSAEHKADHLWRRRRDGELVSFLGYQGCRPGEALALAWECVLDDDRRGIGQSVEFLNTISVEDEDEDRDDSTKTGVDRINALNPFVRADLMEWWLYCGRPKRGLVFPRHPDGAEWTPGSWSNWRSAHWVPALEAVGLDYRSPKHLRHSCLSMLIRGGMNIGEVADLAGHTLQVCLKHYRQAFDRRRLNPADSFDLNESIAAARADVRQVFARPQGIGG